VAGARGDEVFTALADAGGKGLASFLLTGDPELIESEAVQHGLTDYRVIPPGMTRKRPPPP
jgi:hypothetical protein